MSVLWILSLSALMCPISSASHWRRALYPSAFRVKRGTPALLNPSFQKSVEDANLFYEVLWSGAYIDRERGLCTYLIRNWLLSENWAFLRFCVRTFCPEPSLRFSVSALSWHDTTARCGWRTLSALYLHWCLQHNSSSKLTPAIRGSCGQTASYNSMKPLKKT